MYTIMATEQKAIKPTDAIVKMTSRISASYCDRTGPSEVTPAISPMRYLLRN
jgi:hypothetical protein